MAQARHVYRRERGGRARAYELPRAAQGEDPLDEPVERLNKKVNRRADVVGVFPNEGSIIRLIGAVLLEANDEWQTQYRYMQTQYRYMQTEAMAELTPPTIDAVPHQITTQAA